MQNDEIDEIPEFDSEVDSLAIRSTTPLLSRTPPLDDEMIPEFDSEIDSLAIRSKELVSDHKQLSETKVSLIAPPTAGPAVIRGDLVIIGNVQATMIDHWINEGLVFQRVFRYGGAASALLHKLSQTGTVLEKKDDDATRGWSLCVLKHLQCMHAKHGINYSERTFFAYGGSGAHDGLQLKQLVDLVQGNDKPGILVSDVGLNQYWVDVSAIPSGPISFEQYYEALCWRPTPPSNRVPAVMPHYLCISTSQMLKLPASFFERAVHIHQSSQIPDTFFHHIVASIFSLISAPIHE